MYGPALLKIDDSDEDNLVEGSVDSPTWPPSGQLIAYVTAGPQIGVLDLTTRQALELTNGSRPAWQARS